ncbi:hypothetical protein P4B35_23560 [Pontiellaceae bacterium B12227]|nr:hypothetical protein [Pontiellaceae bacterium B12227]
MENESTVEAIRITEFLSAFHMVTLSLLTLLSLTLFIIGFKKSNHNFQWLLSNLSIWIVLFGGLSFVHYWLRHWVTTHSVGYPSNQLWIYYKIESYFPLFAYLSLALVSWTLAIVLRIVIEKNANNRAIE